MMAGANDGNSIKGLTLPWLRSLDGLNTHDEGTAYLCHTFSDAYSPSGYASSVSGGLTTALILPGSANAIGLFLCCIPYETR